MAFIDARLSDLVSFGFKSGPEYQTRVVPMANGTEARNGQWLYPRIRASARYMKFTQQSREELLSAFHVCRGRLHCLQFMDWTDYLARDELIEPSIGTSEPVQLTKTYTLGGQSMIRLIQCTNSSVTVKRNGAAVSGSIDRLTGKFTPAAPWEAGTYTWTGVFYVWMRFDSDYNAFEIINKTGDEHVINSTIDLIEVRR